MVTAQWTKVSGLRWDCLGEAERGQIFHGKSLDFILKPAASGRYLKQIFLKSVAVP